MQKAYQNKCVPIQQDHNDLPRNYLKIITVFSVECYLMYTNLAKHSIADIMFIGWHIEF